MIRQSQIKEWLPGAVEQFRDVMPACDAPLPKIVIASSDSLLDKREILIEEMGALRKESELGFIMELIHGDLGDAILINQKHLSDPRKYSGAKSEFEQYLWHELGHYYAIHNECPDDDLYRFMSPGRAANGEAQTAYWVWKEFIAESISFYVGTHREEPQSSIPDFWHPSQWNPIANFLLQRLDDTLNLYDYTLSEEDLGFYFANLLMSPTTKAYIRAAKEGRLLEHGDNFQLQAIESDSFDPTFLSALPEPLQADMYEVRSALERQVEKQQFWRIDIEFLENLGTLISGMVLHKGLMRLRQGFMGDLR